LIVRLSITIRTKSEKINPIEACRMGSISLCCLQLEEFLTGVDR